MERLSKDKLVTFFVENQIVSSAQHGFLRKKSTIIYFVESVTDSTKYWTYIYSFL